MSLLTFWISPQIWDFSTGDKLAIMKTEYVSENVKKKIKNHGRCDSCISVSLPGISCRETLFCCFLEVSSGKETWGVPLWEAECPERWTVSFWMKGLLYHLYIWLELYFIFQRLWRVYSLHSICKFEWINIKSVHSQSKMYLFLYYVLSS